MRQPDIEIYLKDCQLEQVSQWLSQNLGPASAWQTRGQVHRAYFGETPITWFERAVGKWNSLLIESAATPWEDDQTCAQAAFDALQVEARCSLGGWQESDGEADADQWLKVNAEGAQVFTWRA